MDPKDASTLKQGVDFEIEEAIKEPEVKNQKTEKKDSHTLEELQHASDRTLFKARTVFPFTFFPDTIILDYQKISIIKKKFFLSEKIDSINHADIMHVEVDTGPLFATLKITTKYFSGKPIRIQYLGKKHAIRVRDIMHGLISAKQADISFDEVDKKRLTTRLEQIGKVEG